MLVHPTVCNTNKIQEKVTRSGGSLGLLLDDVTRLFYKYATLSILKEMEFIGQYFDRIEGRLVPVPWCGTSSDAKSRNLGESPS